NLSMSDRFVLHASKETIESEFGVSTERDDYFEPDYNITPGTRLPVVYFEGKARKIREFKWGMIPEGAESEKEGLEHLDLPAEQLLEEDSLQEAFDRRRCIIPANGFYKWKTNKKKSTPFYIRLLSNDIMGLAGIYSIWQSESGREVYSFSILTTEANALVQPVDHRMPVILRPEHYEVWLGTQKLDAGTLDGLLKPYLLTEMAVNRVSEKVNKPESNGPELIQPIPK
ncbi:MAG: SOS response-associated peptidase, partial [Balneolaceae bacterium]|nr:SOS response-associated peptidase [Balneolaceae bacterium]